MGDVTRSHMQSHGAVGSGCERQLHARAQGNDARPPDDHHHQQRLATYRAAMAELIIYYAEMLSMQYY